jgi:cytochrome c oxidase subunit 4
MKRLVYTYCALMLLLGLTIFLATVKMGGHWNFFVGLLIALGKASLILWVFMEAGERRARIFGITAGCLWILILLSMTLSDYLTRDWLQLPGK